MGNKGKQHEVALNRLFEVLSEELHDARPKCEATQFAVQRQAQRMRKRARLSQKGLRDATINAFVDTNTRIGNHRITLDQQIVADARHFITVVLERFATRVDPSNIQVALDPWYMLDLWRFGPGASNGVKGTHAADKISQPMTVTAPCVNLVKRLRTTNPYMASFDLQKGHNGCVLVTGSRMTTVPKNEETERTIAIEPSGNMCLQLAAGKYLEEVLCSIGLDLSTQPTRNRWMARGGSFTGCFATVDLKAASDMISIELVRLLMPTAWFDLLMTIRSPETVLPDGRVLRLNMVSTMGNGFTFPLMTLLITALIYGFRAQRNGPTLRVDWSKTAVFGDDIIVPSREYEGLVDVLESAGFLVNREKSFSEGPFRESCGGDYYEGTDVTPFYVKSLLTDPEIYVAINQVLTWSGRTKILLHRTLLYLGSLLRSGPYLVPEWENPDSGILTSRCPRRYKRLRPRHQEVKLVSDGLHFELPLACAGYIEGRSDGSFYVPRPFKTKYAVDSGRLPRGYQSGWDPSKRDSTVSDWIADYCGLLFPTKE